MDWKNIVNLENLKFEADLSRKNFEYETDPQAFGSAMGAKKLGWNISILPSGQFSCPYHFHHSEEEVFIVLEGKSILRQGDQFKEITKGDLIFFSADAAGAHQIYNHTDQPLKYFALSTTDPQDVCEYPDSKKIYLRRLKKLFKSDTEVDYMKDETNPKAFWPKEYLRE
jgi:uncharacterized cupin superfamily protein